MVSRDPRIMFIEQERLKTFKNWVYKNEPSVSCTAERMAKAGFYTISDQEPETVKCFVCFKQLDGWERQDDPLEEHKKHAPYCPFIKLGKEEKDLTLREVLVLSEELEMKIFDQDHQERVKQLETLKDSLTKALVTKNAQSKKS